MVKKITTFASLFFVNQFASALSFLILVSALGIILGLNDVTLAQISQGINVVWTAPAFYYGWKLLPYAPPRREIQAGKSILLSGFSQIWKTAVGINTHYGGGLRWFLLSVIFAEAGFYAFTVVSVTYLYEQLGFDGGQIGISFAIVYIASFPGSHLGAFVTAKSSPVTSWKICILIFTVITIAGVFVLDRPERGNFAFLWAGLWGIGIGWHYPTQNLIFSLCLPVGQETELTGFFVYCTLILSWLPPLIFTLINESGVGMQWALLSLIIFFFSALLFLQLMDPWVNVIKASEANKMLDNKSHVAKSTEEIPELNP